MSSVALLLSGEVLITPSVDQTTIADYLGKGAQIHFVSSSGKIGEVKHKVSNFTLASIALQIYPDYLSLYRTFFQNETIIKMLEARVVHLTDDISNVACKIKVDEAAFNRHFLKLLQAQNINSQKLENLQTIVNMQMKQNDKLQQMVEKGKKVNEGNYKAIEGQKLQLEGLEKEGEDKKQQLEQLNQVIVKCEEACVANELTLTQQACTIDELKAQIAAEELEHATRMKQEKKRLARSLKRNEARTNHYLNKASEAQAATKIKITYLEQNKTQSSSSYTSDAEGF